MSARLQVRSSLAFCAALPAVDLGTGRTAVEVASAYNHTCAVLDNGAVKCWGFNHEGQLGVGDNASRGVDSGDMGDNLPEVELGSGRTAVSLAIGGKYTCARLDDASVKCWGANHEGQLGLGDIEYRGDNPNEMGDRLPAVDLGTGRRAVAIATGSGHTCARLDDGSVKCWGYNRFGALGQGDTESRGDGPNEMGDNLRPIDL